MSETQEDLIRARAYAIWQAEGCPDDRHDQHWQQAAAEVAQTQGNVVQGDEPVLSTPLVMAAEATPAEAPVRRTRKTAAPAATPAATKARRRKDD